MSVQRHSLPGSELVMESSGGAFFPCFGQSSFHRMQGLSLRQMWLHVCLFIAPRMPIAGGLSDR